MDVEETASSITFTADVPGIDVEKNLSIEVNVPTNVLTIRGERVEDVVADPVHKHKKERHFGSFVNKFTLPPHAIIEEISANLKNGVLKIVVPKTSAALPNVKRIPVDVA
jgi:HSP20 family protein